MCFAFSRAETAEIYYMNKSELSPGKDSLLVKVSNELQFITFIRHSLFLPSVVQVGKKF